MTTRLRHVNPVQLGIFMAALYFLLGIIGVLVTAPFMAMMTTMMPGMPHPGFGFAGMLVVIVFYTALGFIAGVLSAFIYNIVAGMTGGVEMTFVNIVSPAASETAPAVI